MTGDLVVAPVSDRRTVRAWVDLPRRVYAGDPAWVPPLWVGERGEATASHGGAHVSRFVVFDGPRAVGRIGCSLLPGLDPVHLVGYEALDDDRVATALFEAAGAHARAHGRTRLTGPGGHALFDPPAGLQVGGFDRPVPFGTPHHLPYYRHQWEHVGGFTATSTAYTFTTERAGQVIPDWLHDVAGRAEADGYRSPQFRRFRDLDRHTDDLVRVLDAVMAQTHGLPPLHPKDVSALRLRLRVVVRADLVRFVFHHDTLVGVLAAVPEIGRGVQRARGRLLPLGWWSILRERRSGRDVSVLTAAVHPDHQDRGAIAVAAHALFTDLLADRRWDRVHAPMVEATNTRSRMLAESGMGGIATAEYRVYERALDPVVDG